MLEVKEQQAPALEGGATWRAKDLLDTDVLSRDEIELVMQSAQAMREVRSRPSSRLGTLRGVTVVTLFYEQSTRTRASFEVAGKALGADVVNLTATGSSIEKGESLIDTVRTLEAIGADIVVMRHKSSGAPYLAARNTSASVINGGDGTHAHPTQALLDLFTIRRHFGASKASAGHRGDVYSRVARSNIWTLLAGGADVILCGPPTLLPRTLAGTGEYGRIEVTSDFDRALEGADVVMALRIQKERQETGLIPSLREYVSGYQLNARRLALAKEGALVMHPGPMNEGIEIAPDIAHGLSSVIEEQVANGVAVRMALLYLMAMARRG
jgi:aspartate carbamoyltransferase catalytic subunit